MSAGEPRDPRPEAPQAGAGKPRVLVVGVYLADIPNIMVPLSAEFAAATRYEVTQRWIALSPGGTGDVRLPNTVAVVHAPSPKFTLLDRLVGDAAGFDWVIVADDDIAVEVGFLDRFLETATRFDLALCQPARTADSEIEHPITRALPGLAARRTSFVEIGPLFGFRRDAVPHILPFAGNIGMGWGLDLVWPVRLQAAGLRLGIIDAEPVSHRMRKRGAAYDDSVAWNAMQGLLAATPHLAFEQAFQVHEAWPLGATGPQG